MTSKLSSVAFLLLLLFSACDGEIQSVAAETPQDLMNGWVGTWQVELELKKSFLVPEDTTIRGTETVRWILNKQFLQSQQSYADGNFKKLSLIRYDPNEGIFLFWDFDSNGSFPMGITRGKWDQAKKEIVISGAYIGGATAQGVIQFNNDDSAEMHLRLTATDGTVLLDLKARSEQLR
tara:strand:- start:274 stop:807 length:534 start_codon:yes stop_codon:yes gene_type:complete